MVKRKNKNKKYKQRSTKYYREN